MTSKITKYDKATNDSYIMDEFDPQSEVIKYSYTSSRVVQPNFNNYNKQGKPKVIGYYTDWSQYDGRLDGDQTLTNRGRGVDLTLIDPCAFDKLIIGFAGCLGDLGEKKDAINAAAPQFDRTNNGQVTFLDPWGDCQSWRNCGFEGWVDLPMPQSFNQGSSRGVLGGLRDLQKKAMAQGHTLALSFSIGGWTMSYAFSDLVKDPTLRTAFCTSVVDILKRFPMFSEVDIDWEYPGAVGNNNPHDPADGQNYVILMKELVQKFQQNGLSHIKISIAASADPETLMKASVLDLNTVCSPNGGLGINLMTYDFFGTPWADKLAHHTNLYAPEGIWSIDNAVNYLLKIGFPPQQIMIGYAGYSRNAKGAVLTSVSPLAGNYDNSGASHTTGTFESGSTEWYDILNNYLDLENQTGKNGFKLLTDSEANADYLYNPQSQLLLSIDTPRTVFAKGEYVINKGLGGLMTWTADQDSSGLLVNAAREGLGCSIKTQKIDMRPFYFYGEDHITNSSD
ncbi:glycosyl hydrolase family 18 protein [Moellerella wisconsensis]|uniref:Glycosyl hydrolase family 18 protein n=1 Tax=Moellerella wisconsensis TaxID=158849 RepID=A0ACD3Y3T4_9GAMM|nr:glycosyl hydrolase family 18 protein [Moellerella wisconsensis]UNH37519.1 glycosyl hydrolase family 18 protein [Moellerella wisconsensis]